MAVGGTVANRSLHDHPSGTVRFVFLILKKVSWDQTDFSGGAPHRFLSAFSSSPGQFLFCQLS